MGAVVATVSNEIMEPSAADPDLFWEAFLLVVSVALVSYGVRDGARGPAYVGAMGLVAFLFIAGYDTNTSGVDGRGGAPQGRLLGWPLLLVAAGIVAWALSLSGHRRRAGGSERDDG